MVEGPGAPASAMSTRSPRLLACLVGLLAGGASGGWTEDFDGWTTDGSYDGTAIYDHAGVGIWVSENALAGAENARSGYAVRFDDDDQPPPWLEFRGRDGDGIDGGVGTVSFYYRHWDADGKAVAFQFQYRIDGGAWVNAGAAVSVPNDTVYREFSHTLDLPVDNVALRILSTASGERLLIDDFTVTDVAGGEPVISFVAATQTVSEAEGTILAAVQVLPGTAATVGVALVSGEARPGVDLSWSPDALVFSPAAPVQYLAITILDDGVVEDAETATWELTAPAGAATAPDAGRFTLTILDNEVVLDTNRVAFTVMAANTTSGTLQQYEAAGIRIFQALRPDIVAIQEFNVDHAGGRRGFVDDVFGPEFGYMVEGGDEPIPNGVISRWPIIASGEWIDAQVNDRDFAWATIDIPGDRDLHVVSVHLHAAGGSSSRQVEAQTLLSRIQTSFPPDAYIVVAGDFNTGSRSEACVQTLTTILSDARVPVDQIGDDDTNANRDSPYDWVMPNRALDDCHTALRVGGMTFVDGIVFDTRLWAAPPAPALPGDSGVPGMQHMAVMKAFSVEGPSPDPVRLTVASPWGDPVPPTGVTSHAYGSVISPAVPDPVITLGAVRYSVLGWTGSGSIPAAGAGSALPPTTLISDSTLNWLWATNYWLETVAANPTSHWVAAGSTVVIEPAASNYFSFTGWEGDVPPAQATQNPLRLVMDQPRLVRAVVAPDLAALGTPHAWLAGFGWTNEFDVAELADTDGDGMAAWQEYVAGTLPDDASSRFVIAGTAGAEAVAIELATQPGRAYTIEWADRLDGEAWQPFANPALGVHPQTGDEPGFHVFRDDYSPDTTGAVPSTGRRTYRVRVNRVP